MVELCKENFKFFENAYREEIPLYFMFNDEVHVRTIKKLRKLYEEDIVIEFCLYFIDGESSTTGCRIDFFSSLIDLFRELEKNIKLEKNNSILYEAMNMLWNKS